MTSGPPHRIPNHKLVPFHSILIMMMTLVTSIVVIPILIISVYPTIPLSRPPKYGESYP